MQLDIGLIGESTLIQVCNPAAGWIIVPFFQAFVPVFTANKETSPLPDPPIEIQQSLLLQKTIVDDELSVCM